jgi:recombination DNA repair RAD52 pathway protein
LKIFAPAFQEKGEKNWGVGYKVIGELLIPDLRCSYTEAAVGSAQLPQRGEAHDMAVKTAESDALKRAAINLGTQFGLSLYNNGSMRDVVVQTLDKEESASE